MGNQDDRWKQIPSSATRQPIRAPGRFLQMFGKNLHVGFGEHGVRMHREFDDVQTTGDQVSQPI